MRSYVVNKRCEKARAVRRSAFKLRHIFVLAFAFPVLAVSADKLTVTWLEMPVHGLPGRPRNTIGDERFDGRAHLVFGWTQRDQPLRVPWDHLPDYFAAVIDDIGADERALAYTLGWIVHVVSDGLIKGVQPGIDLDLVDGRYTTRNRPVQDLITFHETGIS